jgi:hypothetical protein
MRLKAVSKLQKLWAVTTKLFVPYGPRQNQRRDELEKCRLGVGRNLARRSVWWVFIVDVCVLWRRRSGLSSFGVAWVGDEFAPVTVQLLNYRFGDGNPPIAEHGEICFDASESP